MSRATSFASLFVAIALLAGCDMLGIDSPEKVAAMRESEGKAIGAACRHAGRAIEDCYTLNKKAEKASVFAGWRDMNDYMRENKIEAVAPVIPVQAATPKPKPAPDGDTAEAGGDGDRKPTHEAKAG